MEKNFDITSLMGDDVFPHYHTFSEEGSPFKGLKFAFRELPENWLDLVVEAAEKWLEPKGFDPKATVLHRIGGVPLTGEEYIQYHDAYDSLTAAEKQSFEDVLVAGIRAVLPRIVGDWNAKSDIATGLPLMITKYPSLARALFTLAQTVTLSTEKKISFPR